MTPLFIWLLVFVAITVLSIIGVVVYMYNLDSRLTKAAKDNSRMRWN